MVGVIKRTGTHPGRGIKKDLPVPTTTTIAEQWRGEDYTSGNWTGVNGTVLTAVGSPSSVSSGGTQNAVSLGAGVYMQKTDGCGPLPLGSTVFTLMMTLKTAANTTAFTFNWGALSVNGWMSLLVNAAEVIGIDDFGGFIGTQAVVGDDQWTVITAVCDSDYVTIYNGPTEVLSTPFSFDIQESFIRLNRDWNNATRAATVGDITIWNAALSAAEVASEVATRNTKYCGDSSAGTLTSGSFTAASSTGGTATVTLPDQGRVYVLMETDNSAATYAEIVASPDAYLIEQVAGAVNMAVTGLTVDTEYWPKFAFIDRLGNTTTLVGTSDTTSASATAPAQFGTGAWSISATGVSGQATVTVSTLPDDGGSAITDVEYQIDGGSWVSGGITTAGAFNISSGLTDDVESDVAIRAVNAVGNGTASATKAVTTVDASGSFDATVSTRTSLLSTLASWESDWNGTATSLGISASASRSLGCNDGTYTAMTLDYVFPQRVTISSAQTKHGAVFGATTLSGTNIYLDKIKVSAYTYGAVKLYGSYCGLTKCQILGKTNATLGDTIKLGYGIMATNGVNNCLIEECYIDGFNFGAINYNNTNVTYRKCFVRSFGSMALQTSGSVTNITLDRIYSSGHFYPNVDPGADIHGDFMQLRGGNGITVSKCVYRKGTATGKITRGIPLGDGGLDCYNVTVDNCLLVGNQIQGTGSAEADPGDIRTNIVITNNTMLFPEDDPQNNGSPTSQFICKIVNSAAGAGSSTSGNAQTVANGTGADSGGIVFEVGADSTVADYSAYDTHYNSRPVLSSSLSDLIPKNTSAMYPGTGTAGCYELISDILGGDYPANWDSTVAAPFNTYWGY